MMIDIIHCFSSSMVIRDLTLRSAASFGSFHLIRLLYDEYMFFLIEHKVARATGRTPIAVMSEVCLSFIFHTLLSFPCTFLMCIEVDLIRRVWFVCDSRS